MRGRKKRTLILGILCCLLVFMGVGFAVARTTLNIGGTSTAINTWDVRIANVAVSSKSDGVTNSEEETKIGDDGVSANLQADFIKPGDYITYEVLVENNGSIDATLDELKIDISTDNEADKDLFKVENTLPENKKLTAGESITFTVTITFNKDAEKLPSGEVRFKVGLNYSQGEGLEGGGNTPGENEPEKDWDFEVDENGTITAYNYDLGTDVVVPATNYEGKEIKAINEMSFYPKGNVDLFMSEEPMGMYGIIYEDEPNFTYVKDKLVTMFTMECEGDTSCEQQYKAMMYVCKDTNTCYNIANLEQNKVDPTIGLTITSVPDTVESYGSGTVIPDPDLPLEESMVEPQKNVTTLDLSQAINLTTIGKSAFGDVGLTSVEFGNNSNITTIERYAFQSNAITSLEIPNSVETIGEYAFSNNQIETLTFGTTENVQNQLSKNNKSKLSKLGTNVEKISTTNSKLKTIGNGAFYGNKIVELNLPNTIETIGSSAFSSNQISGELLIPENLTTIGSSAFNGNQISGELVIPQNLTTIGISAFYNNSISKISFADNSRLNKIESNAFCNNDITELEIPSSVTEIGSSAFKNNQLSELVIPKTVTNLESYAFSNNPIEDLTIGKCNTYACSDNLFGTRVKNLTIESGEIGSSAFRSPSSSTSKIENLILGEGVTTIGVYAFENNNISTLTVPKTVTSVGNSAFENNPIEKLTIGKCNTNSCSYNSFGTQVKNLTVESGEIGSFAFESLSDSTTKIESLTLGEGVTTIGKSAFENNAITELTLPSTLTSIGSSAFLNNLINQKLYLPKNIKTIGDFAFENNQILQLEVSEECDSIELGSYVFKDNQIRGVFNTSDNFASIGARAFFNNQLDEVYIDENVIQVEDFAFSGQTSLQRLTIENCSGQLSSTDWGGIAEIVEIKRGEIGDETFDAIYGAIETLILGEGVTSIGFSAFNKNKIKHLVIPASVISIGNNAFGIQHDSSGNPVLESITIKRTKTDFQANVTVGTDWYDNRLNPIITYALS